MNPHEEEAIQWLREIRPPDMTMLAFLEMLYETWTKYNEVMARLQAVVEINDSGERYNHPNADGAMALKNLFEMLETDEE